VPRRARGRPRRRDGSRRSEGEGPAALAVQIVQRTDDLVERRPQPLEQATSRVGRRDASRRAVQQVDADALLQLPDRVAQGRGRDAETYGSPSEAEIVGDRDEGGQIRKLASTHW